MSKYNSKKVVLDGITFDSKDEALYYEQLKKDKEKRLIDDFSLQPKYELIPAFEKNGKKYRAVTYTPDFLVQTTGVEKVAIDVKGFSTQQGELRRKLFEWRYPDIHLIWVTRNLKHGNSDGWIEYDQLMKIRRTRANKLKKISQERAIGD